MANIRKDKGRKTHRIHKKKEIIEKREKENFPEDKSVFGLLYLPRDNMIYSCHEGY